jgi:hypothetical protein
MPEFRQVPEKPVTINRQAGEIQIRQSGVFAPAVSLVKANAWVGTATRSSRRGENMSKLKFSWRRLAALGALGWAAAGAPATFAQTAPSAAAAPAQTTHLTAETRPVSAASQSAAAGHATQTAGTVSAPPKPVPVTGTMHRTVYQQPQSDPNEPPAPAPSTSLNQYDTANRAYMAEPLTATHAPESIGAGQSCSIGGSGCGCNACRCSECCVPYFYSNGWYAGVDYMYMRPNFSSPAAAAQRETVIDPNTNASVITDTVLEYDVEYDSTFRLFGGYRWGDCGESLQFSYWQVEADENFTSPPATATLFFASFEDAIADGVGEVLQTGFSMEMDVWDIDYTKRMPVKAGSPSSCGNCCPPWDWAWSIGARIADYDREHRNTVVNAAGALISTGDIDTRFSGAGPRAGLEGRRYFGDGGKWSAYGVGHMALLLGDYEIRSTRTAGITTTNHEQNFIRTSPVAELEVGVSRQLGCNTLFSAGYQFQAWWEIGRFDTILIGDCECLTSSNVLSFDGLFLRIEHTFGNHHRSKCR